MATIDYSFCTPFWVDYVKSKYILMKNGVNNSDNFKVVIKISNHFSTFFILVYFGSKVCKKSTCTVPLHLWRLVYALYV